MHGLAFRIPQDFLQPADDGGEPGRLAQPRPQALARAAPGGKVEEGILIEGEERAFQERGQRQVVLRQDGEAAERHEVLHGDVLGQHQPVGTGDGQVVPLLQGARQCIDEGVALAHQHDDIAGLHRPRLALFRHRLAADPGGERIGDAPGENVDRRFFRHRVEGRCPVLLVEPRRGGDHLPDVDCARLAPAVGGMDDLAAVRRQAARIGGIEEDPVDGRKHVPRRAEGKEEPDGAEDGFGRPRASRNLASFFREALRPGALEGVDRLFLVAHGEDRSPGDPRRFAGEEVVGQRPDDLPLPGARVLRLVDEDMVDALVELVVHPGAHLLARQEPRRAVDQVVEVEQAARALQIFVIADQPLGDGERRARRLIHAEPPQPVGAGDHMGLCGEKRRFEMRELLF